VPAYASAPADSSKVISWSNGDPQFPNDRIMRFSNDGNWPVGDCFLDKFSYVEVDVTSRRVILHGEGWTTHTNHADVWHSTFQFTDTVGNVVTVGPLDSAQMTVINRTYTWDVVVPFAGTDSFYGSVKWISHC
jgi:hypothetical protein